MTIRSDSAPIAEGVALLLPLLVGASWISGAPPANATATTRPSSAALYTVSGVHVDVTAESAVAAREQAMTEARAQALKMLEARLVPSDALSRVPQVDPNRLLRDFEVVSEKVGSTRYIGTLSVRFDADKVRNFLWSSNIPFSDTRSDPVLVLPVFEPGGQPVLFEATNPWLGAWATLKQGLRVVPFVVPTGDLDDLRAISAVQALGADAGALGAIAARYNVQQVLIAAAAPIGAADDKAGKVDDKAAKADDKTAEDAAAKPGEKAEVKPTETAEKTGARAAAGGLTIRLLRVAQDGSGQDAFTVPGQPGEDQATLLARAVGAVVTRVEDAWKNGTPQGPEHTLLATLPINSFSGWMALRKQVEQVEAVRGVDLKALSPREAKVLLHYSGEIPALQADLAAAGLMLIPAPSGEQGWLLRPRRPGEPAYPAAPYGAASYGAPYGTPPRGGAPYGDTAGPRATPDQTPAPYAAPAAPYSGSAAAP
jgi:hypothetical protein